MKKFLAGLFSVAAIVGTIALFTPTPAVARPGCGTVRCLPCPDGYHLSGQWPDCCRCIKN